MHYLSANAFSRYFYGALVREERKYYIRKKRFFKELQVFQKYTQEYIISFLQTCPIGAHRGNIVHSLYLGFQP